MNLSTCLGDGGNPVRSNDRRRMRVFLFARGEGVRLLFSRVLRMKLSMGFLAQVLFFVVGSLSKVGCTNDQCLAYFAPCFTQRLRRAFCLLVSGLFSFLGGMRSRSLSGSMIRWIRMDSSGLPGTMTSSSVAFSNESSLRSALIAASSGP